MAMMSYHTQSMNCNCGTSTNPMTWPTQARQHPCPRAAPTAETPQFSALSRPSGTCRCNNDGPLNLVQQRVRKLHGFLQRRPTMSLRVHSDVHDRKNCTCGISRPFELSGSKRTCRSQQRARQPPCSRTATVGLHSFPHFWTATPVLHATGMKTTLSRNWTNHGGSTTGSSTIGNVLQLRELHSFLHVETRHLSLHTHGQEKTAVQLALCVPVSVAKQRA